jgi:DNA-binding transcriptional regulator YiaG
MAKQAYPETGYTPANLRHLRNIYGITQTEVGKRTQTALRTVQNWEADVDTQDHSGMPHRKWVMLQKSLRDK